MTIWTSLLLFLLLMLTWSLHMYCSALRNAIEDARDGLPDERIRGVSILPGIPIIPLLFLGLAALIDSWHSPYGALSVAILHVAYGFLLIAYITINWRQTRNPHKQH